MNPEAVESPCPQFSQNASICDNVLYHILNEEQNTPMRLVDLIPDAELLYALEPDELGLRMLPVLASWGGAHPGVQLELRAFLVTVLGNIHHPAEYPAQQSARVEESIREAWAWLEGAALLIQDRRYQHSIRALSRRARQLAQKPEPQRALTARRVPKETLHPVIREDVWSLYHRGKYDTAVFEAMKAVEVAVREAAALEARDIGTDLMRKAFNVDTGPLTDTTAEKSERQARSDLFAGAIGSYKNPHSHRDVALDDPDEAAEIIMLANHLLRIVDDRRPAKSTT
jgi:uncharacterized protein (TIGR02391 family)